MNVPSVCQQILLKRQLLKKTPNKSDIADSRTEVVFDRWGEVYAT